VLFKEIKMIPNEVFYKKYHELAKFNADSDKSKYTDEYLTRMSKLQAEYNKDSEKYAKANGYIIC
jgi:hypothetical protein